MDSVIVNRNPNSDSELANKKCVDDSKDGGNFLRFNQTLQNYLKDTVGNYTYNLTKHDKIQITHVTEIRYLNTGYLLLRKRGIKNLHKNSEAKIGNFLKSTQTSSPTSEPGQQAYHVFVQRLCISKLVQTIMVMEQYLSVGRELILYKVPI